MNESSLSEPDRDGYRAVSGWAIAALLLGGASAAALGGPLLWAVPVAAIVVAAIAMRKTGGDTSAVIGRGIALLGLLLAVLFGVAGITRTATRHYWLDQRAKQFTLGFVRLLQEDKPQAAFQLTIEPELRKPVGDGSAEPYAHDPEIKSRYEVFLKRELVKKLLEHGGDAAVEIDRAEVVIEDSNSDVVRVDGRITYTIDGQKSTEPLKLVAARTDMPVVNDERWIIAFPGE